MVSMRDAAHEAPKEQREGQRVVAPPDPIRCRCDQPSGGLMRSPAWTRTICGTTHEGLAMVFGPNTRLSSRS
jgi:hypothetical protein